MKETDKTPNTPRRKRVGRLDSVGGILTEAAKLYREARRGEISASDASKLATVLVGMRAGREVLDLQQELAELKQQLCPDAPQKRLGAPLRAIEGGTR